MTLPASFPLSMSQVATELGLSLPLSLNHPWVIALGGVGPTLPLGFSDLLGQSGHVNANGTVQQISNVDYRVNLTGTPFFSRFGGYISTLEETTFSTNLLVSNTDLHPTYTGKIKIINTTLGDSLVLSYIGSGQWGGATGGGAGGIGIFGHAGATYNFTIYPSN
ncbi:hypothetical protein [Trinickia sp.]|uniref:hypothetical protein n=1 Tax=Trinickia sp. TaxID=2571163 RepID=UPI003F7DDC87